MSTLTVMTFENMTDAGEALKNLQRVQKADQILIEDSAVVIKDENGKVEILDKRSRAVKVGAVTGGVLGGFLFFFAPVAGVAIGATSGGAIGKLLDTGVEPTFVEQVSNDLQPGTSALFVVTERGNLEAALAALRSLHGSVYHTSLPSEVQQALEEALR
ncbi:MAG TPA: DUF1269 domain-containing protein [Thermomicrobiales bacterium]|nr:DUF1269 domain-containing protein [Thermomicrobiales bacterium]